jgi:hypothetical protein
MMNPNVHANPSLSHDATNRRLLLENAKRGCELPSNSGLFFFEQGSILLLVRSFSCEISLV